MRRCSLLVIAAAFALALMIPSQLAAKKLRIAVSPFIDRSGAQMTTDVSSAGGARQNFGIKGDLGGQVADAIITELVKLGRYEVVERVQLDQVIFEQKMLLAKEDDDDETEGIESRAGNSDAKTLEREKRKEIIDEQIQQRATAEAARVLGADFLVTGSLTEAASSRTGKGYVVFNKKELVGRVVLDTRLVDVKTTKAIWGTTTEGVETLKTKKILGVGKADLAGVALLLGKAARNSANSLVEELVPVLDQFSSGQGNRPVLEVAAALRGTKIYLAAGAKVGIESGDEFALFTLGDPFKIGNKVIREEIEVGTVVVAEVYSDYATGIPPESSSTTALTELTARRRSKAQEEEQSGAPEEEGDTGSPPEAMSANDGSSIDEGRDTSYHLITSASARLRAGPGTNHEIEGVLDRHSRVEVLDTEGEWLKVRTESGSEAWVHSTLTTAEVEQ